MHDFHFPHLSSHSLVYNAKLFRCPCSLHDFWNFLQRGNFRCTFSFDLSILELRYNEVHCHSLKLYPFLSTKILMVSQNLDYCSRKAIHFLKYPTVTVKIIPSSLRFSTLCRENKAFNYTLITLKIRSVYQFSANQKEWNKTNSLQAVKALLKGRKIISASPTLTMHPKWPRYTKYREKLLHGIMGKLHNPPLVKDYFTRRQKQEKTTENQWWQFNRDLIPNSKKTKNIDQRLTEDWL